MPGRPRDEAAVALARELYGQGCSARDVAGRLGVHPVTVQRWLAGSMRRPGRCGDPAADEQILALRDDEHLTFAAIAAKVGMSKTGIRTRYYALTGQPRPERSRP